MKNVYEKLTDGYSGNVLLFFIKNDSDEDRIAILFDKDFKDEKIRISMAFEDSIEHVKKRSEELADKILIYDDFEQLDKTINSDFLLKIIASDTALGVNVMGEILLIQNEPDLLKLELVHIICSYNNFQQITMQFATDVPLILNSDTKLICKVRARETAKLYFYKKQTDESKNLNKQTITLRDGNEDNQGEEAVDLTVLDSRDHSWNFPLVLEISNESDESRNVVLFDSNELFETAQSDNGIKVSSLSPNATYKEMLINKLSGVGTIAMIILQCQEGTFPGKYIKKRDDNGDKTEEDVFKQNEIFLFYNSKRIDGSLSNMPIQFEESRLVGDSNFENDKNQLIAHFKEELDASVTLMLMEMPAHSLYVLYIYPEKDIKRRASEGQLTITFKGD